MVQDIKIKKLLHLSNQWNKDRQTDKKADITCSLDFIGREDYKRLQYSICKWKNNNSNYLR